MKKFLIAVAAIITLVGIHHSGAAAFNYNVDVQVTYDADAIADSDLQIQNWDWTLSGVGSVFDVTVLPPHDAGGTLIGWDLYEAGAVDNGFGPLQAGNYTFAKINSDTMLTLDLTNGYDAVYNYLVDLANYEAVPFTNGTFSVQLTTAPVPLPGSILLLGSGLLGLVGIVRRKRS